MHRLATACFALLLCCASGCAALITARAEFSQDADWENYDQVVVRTLNGRVNLSVDPAATRVSVSGVKQAGGMTLQEAEAHLAQVEVKVGPDTSAAGTLRVEVVYPDELRNRNVAASLTIRVPRSVAADVETSNGSIRASDLRGPSRLATSNGGVVAQRVAGDLSVETSNGRIDLDDVSGNVSARTSNGSVVARTIGGGLKAESSNGGVQAMGVKGDVHVDTSNGRVVVEGEPTPEGTVEVASSNGSIHITLPATLRGELDLRTSNGRVRVDTAALQLSKLETSRQRFSAVVNGGGAGRVIAETSNGSVTLDCR